jgi:hypothetical protein
MSEIIIKDELRQQVEAASGGKQTVLRTAKGAPSYFNIIPAFNCEDVSDHLGTGLHPAFIVNGVEKSEIFIGTYQAVVQDGEALSLPDQDPRVYINFDDARTACIAAGSGFHLMSNWEWAALTLWMIKQGYGDLRGNTDNGKSHSHPDEKGLITKYGRTATGSGPASWRHDGTPYGIADLVGNIWEWQDGLKLHDGRVIMPEDNNFLLSEGEWPQTGTVIDLADGGLQLSDVIASERDWTGEWFKDLTVKAGYEVPVALKRALICPVEGSTPSGRFWADNSEGFEALSIRGGHWIGGGYAGLGALYLFFGRFLSDSILGFRPAFIG